MTLGQQRFAVTIHFPEGGLQRRNEGFFHPKVQQERVQPWMFSLGLIAEPNLSLASEEWALL